VPFLKKPDPHAPKTAPGRTGARQLISAILMGMLLAVGFIGAAAFADADGNLAQSTPPQMHQAAPPSNGSTAHTPGLTPGAD